MGFTSGRSTSKGKAFSPQLPYLLEEQLPKRAGSLVSSLSDDDREVLTYILSFGLHLQMLVGVVFPAENLQWKSWKFSSAANVGLHHQRISSRSLKPGTKLGKTPSLLSHKISCSCDCFSCYSSFWSRWASSPNSDLLSKIIEITEEEEDGKVENGNGSTKKQEKKGPNKRASGKRTDGKKPILRRSEARLKPSVLSRAMSELTKSITNNQSSDETTVPTAMDVMYNAVWDNAIVDQPVAVDMPLVVEFVIPPEAGSESLLASPDVRDACGRNSSLWENESRVAVPAGVEVPYQSTWDHDKESVALEDEVHGCLPTQALTGESPRGKCGAKIHRITKCKCSQIMPVDFEGGMYMANEDEKSHQVIESGEGFQSPRLKDVNYRDRGVLYRFFPYPLYDIATRLWDLVSLGPRGHLMEYY